MRGLLSIFVRRKQIRIEFEYVGKEHIDHLIKSIKEKYELTEDWSGNLYCSIKLHWDYNKHTVDISMPGFIKKLLQKCKDKMPTKPQHCPYTPVPKQYGAEAQAPLPVAISPKLSDGEIKEIQRIVRSILSYARAVDITILMALSSIASEQHTRHHEHDGKGQAIVGLPCHTSGRNHSVSSVRHDLERPLGCILSVINKGT